MKIEINTILEPFPMPFPDAVWTTAIIRDVRQFDEIEVAANVRRAYIELREEILRNAQTAGRELHVMRLWNHVPGITEKMTDGRDRYMAFNAGRFAAMCEWYGGASRLLDRAPAASGVGHDGDDLLIIAMAITEPGVAVQNPLQVPAIDYSQRFGLRPPCFSRATRIGNTLLVSGTAAIRGEESVAVDLIGQLDITFENLAALTPGGLADYRSLRVYLPEIDDEEAVAARLMEEFDEDCDITFMQADLCRNELLVEIEGIAEDSSTHGGAI